MLQHGAKSKTNSAPRNGDEKTFYILEVQSKRERSCIKIAERIPFFLAKNLSILIWLLLRKSQMNAKLNKYPEKQLFGNKNIDTETESIKSKHNKIIFPLYLIFYFQQEIPVFERLLADLRFR